jgi:hypothetical protein
MEEGGLRAVSGMPAMTDRRKLSDAELQSAATGFGYD